MQSLRWRSGEPASPTLARAHRGSADVGLVPRVRRPVVPERNGHLARVICSAPTGNGTRRCDVDPRRRRRAVAQLAWGLGDCGWGALAYLGAGIVIGVADRRRRTRSATAPATVENLEIGAYAVALSTIGNVLAFLGVPWLASRRKGLRSLAADFGSARQGDRHPDRTRLRLRRPDRRRHRRHLDRPCTRREGHHHEHAGRRPRLGLAVRSPSCWRSASSRR